MSKPLIIATRKSPLAMWQAEHVKALLEAQHPELRVELLSMSTRGDKILDSPLAKIGGKGLFVKELERALLEGEADIAVHSLKDVPMEFPPGLSLGVVMERHDPHDAFVSNQHATLLELPEGAVVGTSSLRRQCQIQAARPDLTIKWLRGNVNTRLKKLDDGEYDAIILAASGLKRLGFEDRIREVIHADLVLPAGGQGALGIELRSDDERVAQLISGLAHEPTAVRVTAERAMNRHLNGGCQVPIGAYAEIEADTNGDQTLRFRGLVGSEDGSKMLRAEHRGALADAEVIGIQVAEELLAQGAGDILAEVYADK